MSNNRVAYEEGILAYRRSAIAACKDFDYMSVMPDCIKRIKKAESEGEIARIMRTCRDIMFN